MNRVFASVLVLCVSVGPVSAQKTKDAKKPEEALKLLVEAAKAGDSDAFLGQFVTQLRTFMGFQIKEEALEESRDQALDEKFGKADGEKKPRRNFKASLAELKGVEIVKTTEVGKDVVVFGTKTTTLKDGKEEVKESDMHVLKIDGSWKIGPPADYSKGAAKIFKEMDAFLPRFKEQMAGVLDARQAVIKDVKAGKYKTREEAVKAFRLAGKSEKGTKEKKPDEKR